jgi:PD-(D/E)XK nuclease superfamily protein
MAIDLRYRQSTLKAFTECPRRTVLDMGATTGLVGAAADLGSALHAVVARVLETLQMTGEAQIPTQEAVEIMYEVMAEGPWVLGLENQDWLRQMVLSFCRYEWVPQNILAVERRLSVDIVCPDGKTRTFTGTPDAVIREGQGIALPDFKSGLAVPRTPREPPPEGQPIKGWEYLSDGGYFQGRCYGFLGLSEWPAARWATPREINLRWNGPPREAAVGREDMEHIARQLGLLMMQLDGALDGRAELREPRPGKQCANRCPVARSCPIPAEQRGLGALETDEDATAEANRWVTIRALDKQMREALKARHEMTETMIPTNDGLLGWHEKPNGGRSFEIR